MSCSFTVSCENGVLVSDCCAAIEWAKTCFPNLSCPPCEKTKQIFLCTQEKCRGFVEFHYNCSCEESITPPDGFELSQPCTTLSGGAGVYTKDLGVIECDSDINQLKDQCDSMAIQCCEEQGGSYITREYYDSNIAGTDAASFLVVGQCWKICPDNTEDYDCSKSTCTLEDLLDGLYTNQCVQLIVRKPDFTFEIRNDLLTGNCCDQNQVDENGYAYSPCLESLGYPRGSYCESGPWVPFELPSVGSCYALLNPFFPDCFCESISPFRVIENKDKIIIKKSNANSDCLEIGGITKTVYADWDCCTGTSASPPNISFELEGSFCDLQYDDFGLYKDSSFGKDRGQFEDGCVVWSNHDGPGCKCCYCDTVCIDNQVNIIKSRLVGNKIKIKLNKKQLFKFVKNKMKK